MRHKAANVDYVVSSIFFGGGTPSLMEPRIVGKIIDAISSLFVMSPDVEITLEANPSTFEIEKLKDFKSAGINRLSLGIQSLQDRHLQFLGRKHSSQEAIMAIKAAEKVFDNFSIDLMYGYSDQTNQEWQEDIGKVLKDFNICHISVYHLTIEKGTKFFALHKDKQLLLPTEKELHKMYNTTREILNQHGMKRYEVSNYAIDDKSQSKHNLLYWHIEDYIGIGPGAHGRIIDTQSGLRIETMTYHSPNKWMQMLGQNDHGMQKMIPLERKLQIREILLMGLRIADGIDINSIEQRLGFSLQPIVEVIKKSAMIENKMITISKSHIRPTSAGMDIVNSITKFIINQLEE